MFVNLNIPSFNELLRKFVFNFKTRIIESANSLVNGIVTSVLQYHYLVQYGPGGVLFLTLTHNNSYFLC